MTWEVKTWELFNSLWLGLSVTQSTWVLIVPTESDHCGDCIYHGVTTMLGTARASGLFHPFLQVPGSCPPWDGSFMWIHVIWLSPAHCVDHTRLPVLFSDLRSMVLHSNPGPLIPQPVVRRWQQHWSWCSSHLALVCVSVFYSHWTSSYIDILPLTMLHRIFSIVCDPGVF